MLIMDVEDGLMMVVPKASLIDVPTLGRLVLIVLQAVL